MLKIDTQEPKSLLELATKEGLEFTRERLAIGDLLYGDICIERKEMRDFMSSMRDGRLLIQVQNMMDNYPHNYLIISGRFSKRDKYKIKNYLGMLVSISVRTPVKILHVKDDYELIYVVKKIIEKSTDGKDFHRTVMRKAHAESPQLTMLCSIPGVGKKAAKLILDKFDSIGQLSQVSEKEITEIKGVGKVTAKKIHSCLTTK